MSSWRYLTLTDKSMTRNSSLDMKISGTVEMGGSSSHMSVYSGDVSCLCDPPVYTCTCSSALRHLPHFPIWPTRLIAPHPGRTGKRIVRLPLSGTVVVALSHSFPKLESFEISTPAYDELILPATFLSGSTSQKLRSLRICSACLACVALRYPFNVFSDSSTASR